MDRVEFKKLREQANLSQKAMGKLIGLSAFTISQWENAACDPKGGWNGSGLKDKLKKITEASRVDFRVSAQQRRVATPSPIPPFVQVLASTLLDKNRLFEARVLLVEAKRAGLDIDRLLGLLGEESS